MELMATVHMSEAEVARDLHAALAKVQRGVEIVIERDNRPIAVLKQSASARPGRKISECIALAKAYEEKLGDAPAPDANFARDVQEGIDAHREPIRNVWDE
jgi:antitoxin (DNA-binding transcriptional repressor) of toxin-antitoxin stability system